MLTEAHKAELELIEQGLLSAIGEPGYDGLKPLWQSMRYSLLSGGKRFRPLLSLLTARALKQSSERALPIAIAVEMIHTYSLIHDDLPAMDDDDVRRGQPTNHKVHGDAMALLAGDALLTAAFGVAAGGNNAQVVAELSAAAGPRGMVGGQVMDINIGAGVTVEQLQKIHELKTGALIAISVTGAARLCGADAKQMSALEKYGRSLGFAFQLADDLQDSDSYTSLLGAGKTQELLAHASTQALTALQSFGPEAEPLREMVRFNQARV